MKFRKKQILLFSLLLFILFGGFLFFLDSALAQDVNFGLQPIAEGTGLGTTDLRTIIAKIIRAVLGFLGIAALGIVLYGGYTFMTAGGEEEKISQGKKILTNGLIGLVIILLAFAITQFIINRLAEATGYRGGDTNYLCSDPTYALQNPKICNPSDWCVIDPEICCLKDNFVVQSITPNTTNTNMRNVVVRAIFSQKIDFRNGEDIKIFYGNNDDITDQFNFNVLGNGSLDDNSMVEATYSGAGRCNDGSICLPKGTYSVKVSPEMIDKNGQRITTETSCGSKPLEANFTVNYETSAGYLSFDGVDDYVEIVSNDFNPGKEDFSISVWAKSTEFISNSSIVQKGAYYYDIQTGFNIGHISNPKNVKFVVDDDSTSISGQPTPKDNYTKTVLSDPSSTSGVYDWKHFVLVKAGEKMIGYVDGQLAGEMNGIIGNIASDRNLFIGKNIISGKTYKGFVDDVKFYKRALSFDEVGNLFQRKNINRSNLIGEWNFDETGNVAIDSSGQGHNGVISGAQFVVKDTVADIDKDEIAPILGPINIQGNVSSQGHFYLGNSYIISSQMTDNSGVGYVEFNLDNVKADGSPKKEEFNYLDGPRIKPNSSDAPVGNPYLYDYSLYLPSNLKALEYYQIALHGFDIDSNDTIVTTTFRVVGWHCRNGIQDGNETDVDTGGDCGADDGGYCEYDYDCSPDFKCIDNQCKASPVITDIYPMHGAAGNWVTIVGRHFGATVGEVSFGLDTNGDNTYDDSWIPASLANCDSDKTWHDGWIIVEVPSDAVYSLNTLASLRVTRADNGLSDTSVDALGPKPGGTGLYNKDGEKMPGLCSVKGADTSDYPGATAVPAQTPIVLIGKSFDVNTAPGRGVMFGGFYDTTIGKMSGGREAPVTSWADTTIFSSVLKNPTFGPQVVWVTVNGKTSNAIPFTVLKDDDLSNQVPVIEQIDPESVTQNSLLTIWGKNFGSVPGGVLVAKTKADALACVANFDNKKCEKLFVQGDAGFPSQCDGSWHNDEVVAMIPEGSWLGGSITEEAGYSVKTLADQKSFNINEQVDSVKNALKFEDSFVLDITYRLDKKPGVHESTSQIIESNRQFLTFDGIDDYVEVPGIDLTGKSFTIEFFARRGEISGDDDFIIGQGNSASYRGLQIGFRPTNKFTFGFWGTDLNTNQVFTDTNLHHWAVTYDFGTKTKKAYRDGEFLGQVSGDTYIYDSGSKLNIGGWAADTYGGRYFVGDIDEVRILEGVLTQQDIRNNSGALASFDPRENTLAWYHFDESDGSDIVIDASGNGKNGMLKNGVIRGGENITYEVVGGSELSEAIVGSQMGYGLVFPYSKDNDKYQQCFLLSKGSDEDPAFACSQFLDLIEGQTYHHFVSWNKNSYDPNNSALTFYNPDEYSSININPELDSEQLDFIITKLLAGGNGDDLADIEYTLYDLKILPGTSLNRELITSMFTDNDITGWVDLMDLAGIDVLDEPIITSGLAPGDFYVVLENSNNLSSSGDNTVEITTGLPQPGICKIQPRKGPAPLPENQYLTLRGINFKNPLIGNPLVYFWKKGSVGNNLNTWLSSDKDFYRNYQVVQGIPTADTVITSIPVSTAGDTLYNPGYIKIKTADNRESNSVRYDIENCTLADDDVKDYMTTKNYHCCSTEGEEFADFGQWKNTVCDGDTVTGGYVWRFTNGIIPVVPEVMEECIDTSQPTPVPSIMWERGDEACVNSVVSLRFNMSMDGSTINRDTVALYKCDTNENGEANCSNSAKEAVILGEQEPNYVVGNALTVFTPTDDNELDPNTWYQVELSQDIKSLTVERSYNQNVTSSLPLKVEKACGNNTAYCYQFKTGQANDAGCELKEIGIEPSSYLTHLLGKLMVPGTDNPFRYLLWGRGAYECNPIVIDGLGWDWSSSDEDLATVSQVTDDAYYEDILAEVIAIENTYPGTVDVLAGAVLNEVAYNASSSLTINLLDPEVVEVWPSNCTEACINTILGVRFNMMMSTSSYDGNIRIDECTNQSCVSFTGNSYTLEILGTSDDYVLKAGISSASHGDDPYLLKNTWYVVTVEGGADGSGILAKASLVDDTLVKPMLADYQWKFRTKNDDSPCQISDVRVSPSEYTAYAIGEKTKYSVSAFASPDQCSPYGQELNPWNYGWEWTSGASSIVTISNFETGLGQQSFCGYSCTLPGSDVSSEYFDKPVCGNGIVDAGEDCDIAGTTPEPDENDEIPGVSCNYTCLRPGNNNITNTTSTEDTGLCGDGFVSSTLGEECDPAIDSYCNNNCTWKGSSQVFNSNDFNAPLCGLGSEFGSGEGEVTAGEECDIALTTSTAGTLGHINYSQVGCSDNCLHVGSALSQEWCDNYTGTSAQAIKACNNAISICGNGYIEKGEECEALATSLLVVSGTDPISQISISTASPGSYCSDSCQLKNICELTSIPEKITVSGPGLRCEAGEEGCNDDCTLAGSSVKYFDYSLCGDATIGTGEYGGCEVATADRDSLGQNPVQMATAVGQGTVDTATGKQTTYIQALAKSYWLGDALELLGAGQESGRGSYSVQCGYSEFSEPKNGKMNDCKNSTEGVGEDSCCYARQYRTSEYPTDGQGLSTGDLARPVCRNSFIAFQTSGVLDEKSLLGHVIIAEGHPEVDYNCADHGRLDVTGRVSSTLAINTTAGLPWWQKAWQWIKGLFGETSLASDFALDDINVWCSASISAEPRITTKWNATGTAVTSTVGIYIKDLMASNTVYAIFLDGGNDGIRDRRGVGISSPDLVSLNDSWVFMTGDDICRVDSVSVDPEKFVFDEPNTTSTFLAEAKTKTGEMIVPIDEHYDWDWQWNPQNNEIFTIPGDNAPDVVISSKNIEGKVMAVANARILFDESMEGNQLGQVISGTTDLTAMFCENLWPPLAYYPFEDGIGFDKTSNISGFNNGVFDGSALVDFEGEYFNFRMGYCADAGSSGDITDDLPLLKPFTFIKPDSTLPENVLQKFLFFTDKEYEDVIGIQIFKNLNYLSVPDWFDANNLEKSALRSVTIAGYSGLGDGNNYYIAALNQTSEGDVYSNIYQFSINPDAQPESRKVFEMLLDSLEFNINISDVGKCLEAGQSIFTNPLAYNNDYPCTTSQTDFDCRNEDGDVATSSLSGVCSNAKTKMLRDWNKLHDLRIAEKNIENYRTQNGKYPNLSSGTYIPGYTVSKWPSWGLLSSVVGSLPLDPINKWAGCDSDAEQNTCWNPVDLQYSCPKYSSVYEYQSLLDGADYRLYVPLEYFSMTSPVVDKFLVSPGTKIVNGPWCISGGVHSPNANQCGDGLIGYGEECDPPGKVAVGSYGYNPNTSGDTGTCATFQANTSWDNSCLVNADCGATFQINTEGGLTMYSDNPGSICTLDGLPLYDYNQSLSGDYNAFGCTSDDQCKQRDVYTSAGFVNGIGCVSLIRLGVVDTIYNIGCPLNADGSDNFDNLLNGGEITCRNINDPDDPNSVMGLIANTNEPVSCLNAPPNVVLNTCPTDQSAEKFCSNSCIWNYGSCKQSIGVCGNGVVEGFEACDDGTLNGTYGHCADENSINVYTGQPVGECLGLHETYCGNDQIDYKDGKALEVCEKVDDVLITYSKNIGTCDDGSERGCIADKNCYSSLGFDGNGDRLYAEPTISFGDKFTIEFWVKPRAGMRFYSTPIISLHRSSTDPGSTDEGDYFALEISQDKRVGFGKAGEMDSIDQRGYIKTAPTIFNVNEWNHIAVAYKHDGTTENLAEVKIYVNGEQKISKDNFLISSSTVVDNIYIGNPPYLENYGFIGQVDEFRIYNTDLAATIINGQYNAGIIGSEEPSLSLGRLIVGWHFDKGYGIGVSDYGDDHIADGVLIGTKWAESELYPISCVEPASKKYTYMRYGDQWGNWEQVKGQCSGNFLCEFLGSLVHLDMTNKLNSNDYRDKYCTGRDDIMILCRDDDDCFGPVSSDKIFEEDEFTPSNLLSMYNSFSTQNQQYGTCEDIPTGVKLGAPYNHYEDLSCAWDCQDYGSYCGDNHPDLPYEACDDGNDVDTDACKNNCQLQPSPQTPGTPTSNKKVCGDGIKDNPNDDKLIEACDKGADNGKACVPEYGKSCTYCSVDCGEVLTKDSELYCGDGVVSAGYEVCDLDSSGQVLGEDGSVETCDDKGTYQCVDDCTKLENNCVECGMFTSQNKPNPKVAFINPMLAFDKWGDFSGSYLNVSLLHTQAGGWTGYLYKKFNENVSGDIGSPELYHYFGTSAITTTTAKSYGIEANAMCDQDYGLFFNHYSICDELGYLTAGNPCLLNYKKMWEQGYGDIFDYPVNNEVGEIRNDYVVSPALPEGQFRVVIKWNNWSGSNSFAGLVYNDEFAEADHRIVTSSAKSASIVSLMASDTQHQCSDVEKNLFGFWVPKNCTGYYSKIMGAAYMVFVHPILLGADISVQSFTINTLSDTKSYAFFVQSLQGNPINKVVNLDKLNLTVEVYGYHEGQDNTYSIYEPIAEFSFQSAKNEAPSTNIVAKYWHVFNLVRKSNGDYEIKPMGLGNGSIETDFCDVVDNMPVSDTAHCLL